MSENRPMELGDLLRSLQDGGVRDSEGAFTIDLQRAAPKLRTFLLQNPTHYALKLIQAGIAGGCTAVHVTTDAQHFRTCFEGLVWQAGDLNHLFYYLLEAKPTIQNRSLRQLATAINSAVHLGAYRITLEVCDGTKAFRYHWTTTGPQMEPCRPRSAAPMTTFTLRRALRDVADGWWSNLNRDLVPLLTGSRAAMDGEKGLLYDRCRYCTVPLTLNGSSLARSEFGAGWRQGRPVPDNHHLLEYAVAADPEQFSGLRLAKQSRASFHLGDRAASCHRALLALPARWLEASEIYTIEDGVLLAIDTPYLGLPGIIALACGSRLTRDLAGFTLARDEQYQRFLRQLAQDARDLRAEVVRSEKQYPSLVGTWREGRHWDL